MHEIYIKPFSLCMKYVLNPLYVDPYGPHVHHVKRPYGVQFERKGGSHRHGFHTEVS
jgi:hypothetical protein